MRPCLMAGCGRQYGLFYVLAESDVQLIQMAGTGIEPAISAL